MSRMDGEKALEVEKSGGVEQQMVERVVGEKVSVVGEEPDLMMGRRSLSTRG